MNKVIFLLSIIMFFFKSSATANYEKKIYDFSIESITGETINIKDYKEPSEKVKKIIETDLNDLKANMFQDENILRAAAGGTDPKTLNKVLIADFIQKKYPDL